MSRITPVSAKKRKLEEAMRGKTSGKPRKRIRKQKHYHSSSEDEDEEQEDTGFAPVNLGESDDEQPAKSQSKKQKKEARTSKTSLASRSSKHTKRPIPQKRDASSSPEPDRDEEDGYSSAEESQTEDQPVVDPVQLTKKPASQSTRDQDADSNSSSEDSTDSDNETSQQAHKTSKPKSKRNDPTAFSTSISKILSTKLPTSTRSDPVLARSHAASQTAHELQSTRLEARARAKLRADKQTALQKGRTTDVLGIERGITGEVAEKEKGLRKIAQRGVIQLFNAFRAAHVRAEEARREERRKGTVGMGERERKVNEVSKESFLELIGGKKGGAANVTKS